MLSRLLKLIFRLQHFPGQQLNFPDCLLSTNACLSLPATARAGTQAPRFVLSGSVSDADDRGAADGATLSFEKRRANSDTVTPCGSGDRISSCSSWLVLSSGAAPFACPQLLPPADRLGALEDQVMFKVGNLDCVRPQEQRTIKRLGPRMYADPQ